MSMKKAIYIMFFVLLLAAACIVYVPSDLSDEPYYDRYESDWDMSQVYDYLSPHGYWVQRAPYGYVWVPTSIRYNWRPYTYGRWVWTDYGWMWISSYQWGWVPFHFGRWGYDVHLGWYWVPGDIWAPAWVSWRYSNLYIGWAPLPPDAPFMPGTGVVFQGGGIPYNTWIFIQVNYFTHYNIHSYVLPFERNPTIINMTVQKTSLRMHNDHVYNEGLNAGFVENITRTPIRKYELQPKGTAGPTRIEHGQVTVFNAKFIDRKTAQPDKVLSEREAEDRVQKRITTRLQDLKESDIERRHREEMKQIEATQQKEVVEIRKDMQKETSKAHSQTEKARVTKEYEAKIKKLKEKHTTEKRKVTERHKTETQKVKKKKR
jgi:hypothetical protein